MMRASPARIALYVISALVLVYLIIPVLIIAPISFSSARFLTFPPPSFSLRWYQQYFSNPAWMQATRVTLTVALLTVVIATPLGVAAAYAISQSKLRIMRVIHMALLLPLVVADIMRGTGRFNLGLGIVGSAVGIGAALSTTLAGYAMDHFGCSVAFVALAGIGACGGILAWLMPETRPNGPLRSAAGIEKPNRLVGQSGPDLTGN